VAPCETRTFAATNTHAAPVLRERHCCKALLRSWSCHTSLPPPTLRCHPETNGSAQWHPGFSTKSTQQHKVAVINARNCSIFVLQRPCTSKEGTYHTLSAVVALHSLAVPGLLCRRVTLSFCEPCGNIYSLESKVVMADCSFELVCGCS